MDWKLKEQAPQSFIHQFPEFSPLVLNLLWERAIRTSHAIDEFFNPDYGADIHNPLLLSGMGQATVRIVDAIIKKQKIGIFSDYDVDGVSGGAMFSSLLKKVGAQYKIYIPDRARDGYGMNVKGVRELGLWGAQLIVVIDSGVTDFNEIDCARELGMDVIVVDHHQPLDRLPKAHTILNPHVAGDTYPFKDLVATGIVFKLVCALVPLLREKGFYFQEGYEKWFLDLVALATIADMAPLVGENRLLTKYGLGVLAKTSRVGLRSLMEVAGVRPVIAEPTWESQLAQADSGRRTRKHPSTNLNSQTISFLLVNRINAASRMDHASISYELMMTDSKEEAMRLAKILDDRGRDRVELVRRIMEQFEQTYLSNEDPIIFAGSREWPIGVLGIVANTIVEKYHKPAFIYESRDDESLGSIRSEKGKNMVELLMMCKDYLVEYGGHPQSAGFRFKTGTEQSLKRCLIQNAPKLKEEVPFLEIDLVLSLSDVNMELFNILQTFEPFGVANPTPRFLFKHVKIIEKKLIGKDKRHTKLTIADDKIFGRFVHALAFNKLFPEHLRVGEYVDVVAEIMSDEYRGMLTLSLKIIDIKPCI